MESDLIRLSPAPKLTFIDFNKCFDINNIETIASLIHNIDKELALLMYSEAFPIKYLYDYIFKSDLAKKYTLLVALYSHTTFYKDNNVSLYINHIEKLLNIKKEYFYGSKLHISQ